MTDLQPGARPGPADEKGQPPGATPTSVLAARHRNGTAAADDRIERAVAEAIDRVSANGYPGRFLIHDDHVWCVSCRSRLSTRDIRWSVLEMVAGAQGTMMVGGFRCPVCRERGTAAAALSRLLG